MELKRIVPGQIADKDFLNAWKDEIEDMFSGDNIENHHLNYPYHTFCHRINEQVTNALEEITVAAGRAWRFATPSDRQPDVAYLADITIAATGLTYAVPANATLTFYISVYDISGTILLDSLLEEEVITAAQPVSISWKSSTELVAYGTAASAGMLIEYRFAVTGDDIDGGNFQITANWKYENVDKGL